MRSCSLKVKNLVLKINVVNRRRLVFSRAYGRQDQDKITTRQEKISSIAFLVAVHPLQNDQILCSNGV